MEEATRLVLADDHPFILEGLKSILEKEPDLEVAATCQDGEEALRAIRELSPDIAVLDLAMPSKSGLEVLRAMTEMGSPTRPVILAAAPSEREVLEAVRLGARGIVPKEVAPIFLVTCIRAVSRGGEWFERGIASRALSNVTRQGVGWSEAALLTDREREIVRMVAAGLRNKEIAWKLSITEGTVKMHIHNIFSKVGASNRVALARYAQERRIT